MTYLHCEVTLDIGPGNQITAEWKLGTERPRSASSDVAFSSALVARVRDRIADDRNSTAEAEDERIDLGEDLFKAMFPRAGGLRRMLLGRIRDTLAEGNGVRVAIHCAPDLELLPWELARTDGEYLALIEGISIVRLGDPSIPDSTTWREEGLGIFFVDAGQSLAGEELGGDSRQKAGIDERLVVDILDDRVKWTDVKSGLEQTSANVFHFTGHGRKGANNDDPCLLFSAKDPDEEPDRIPCRLLEGALSGSTIQLAVIAACYAGVDDFWSGLGTRLLGKGVAAVVSMQASLENEAGDIFAGRLYDLLAQGSSLDDSVAAARRAVHEKSTYGDWWLPVLHTRATEALRFAPELATSSSATSSIPPSIKIRRLPATVPLSEGKETILWRPQGPPIEATQTVVLSSDGRSCALAGRGGELVVGILGTHGNMYWWPSFTISPGISVVGIHSHPLSAELLVNLLGSTRRLQVDDRGHYHEADEWTGLALSGVWTGAGFTWISDSGCVETDDDHHPLPIPVSGCRMLDAALGGQQRLASWMVDEDLVVCYSDLSVPNHFELRTVALDRVPDDLVVARSSTGDAPTTTFVNVDNQLLGWMWDDLNREER